MVFEQTLWILTILYTSELWVLKAAFLALFWGLFSRVQSRAIWALYFVIALTVLTFGGAMGVVLGWCTPIHYNW